MKLGRSVIALVALLASAACTHAPPAPPDPDAWRGEAAKLMPYLPPVLGSCPSTASAITSHTPRGAAGSEYIASRAYDCNGRSLRVALHAGNISILTKELDEQHAKLASDPEATFKDVMIGGGHGMFTSHTFSNDDGTKTPSSELDVIVHHVVVIATLEYPARDELIPIANALDFAGLQKLDPRQVP